ncbi:cytoplasmic dynein 1 intermediate chain 2-like isoform X3 [Liolophura sinensis]|uniref:cytoplasmic dynein 1 intermediate chain 2-like isoform X3 n=1 Tax=Liolophura sinensis TaxID=3198878 RepID=UPI003158067F
MSETNRKAELERKKARLEAMRQERQRKEEERRRKNIKTEDVATAKGTGGKSQDVDQLFMELGLPPSAPKGREVPSTDSSATSTPSHSSSHEGEQSAAPVTQTVTSGQKSKVKLSVCKVSETNILPKEMVTYSKETQTIVTEPAERDARSRDYYGSPRYGSPRYGSPKFHFPHLEWDDEFDEDDDADSLDVTVSSPPVQPHKMPHVEMVKPAMTEAELLAAQKEALEVKLRDMTDEERKQIINTEEFQSFFMRTSRIVERALAEDLDIFTDYSAGDGEGKDDDQLAGERLKLNRDFYDERWSKHRTITSMDWSTQFPELLVASYNANEDMPHDPDGVALVWNVKFKKTTPDYVFHCQSAVMSTCFAKFHPNLVVGGTYSGQIVLWDNRVNKRTPVQRTPLSAAAHTHPVYCVNVVGTQNAHNLISVSTDGKICSWSLDMLSQPQDSMELMHKQARAVAVTSMSFLSGDVNNFVVGGEDCVVYSGCRHGSKAGVNEAFEGHQGPITGIDCHTVPGQIDFSPYFLTSSFDWTIKLWSIKEQKHIHSFEDNSDYVYDVQWSPIHPALFASVDGMGRLDLWNLNSETEVPSATAAMENTVALNHCRWHESGHQIAAGDDLGRIYVYDVGEHIANPKGDEWSRFKNTLMELRQNAAEREEDSLSQSSLGKTSTPLR